MSTQDSAAAEVCRCGHPRAAHEHYRRGADCALCPSGECARFRRRWALLTRMRGTGTCDAATLARMAERAFPVVFARHVPTTADFYQHLGFERHVQLPADGEPGYVGLRRGMFEIAVVSAVWPQDQYSLTPAGDGQPVRFEMFVYVDDVDATVAALRGNGTPVLRDPMDMPWGERVAYLADPDGNPVAVAQSGP